MRHAFQYLLDAMVKIIEQNIWKNDNMPCKSPSMSNIRNWIWI
jgi:hypothetical protein